MLNQHMTPFCCRAQDYLVAEGSNEPLLTVAGDVQFDAKYFYSLDGVKWTDLQVMAELTAVCKINGVGDSSLWSGIRSCS